MVRFPDLSMVCWPAVASLGCGVAGGVLAVCLELGLVPHIGLSILFLSFNLSTISGFLAIFLGIGGHVQIRQSMGILEGRGIATVGMILGILVVFVSLLQTM